MSSVWRILPVKQGREEIRIQKAIRCRRTYSLVITGRKEKLVHQKEVKGTHKLESIGGETS
jgi:hypothetical protein